jgi:hypothetical protein
VSDPAFEYAGGLRETVKVRVQHELFGLSGGAQQSDLADDERPWSGRL